MSMLSPARRRSQGRVNSKQPPARSMPGRGSSVASSAGSEHSDALLRAVAAAVNEKQEAAGMLSVNLPSDAVWQPLQPRTPNAPHLGLRQKEEKDQRERWRKMAEHERQLRIREDADNERRRQLEAMERDVERRERATERREQDAVKRQREVVTCLSHLRNPASGQYFQQLGQARRSLDDGCKNLESLEHAQLLKGLIAERTVAERTGLCAAESEQRARVFSEEWFHLSQLLVEERAVTTKQGKDTAVNLARREYVLQGEIQKVMAREATVDQRLRMLESEAEALDAMRRGLISEQRALDDGRAALLRARPGVGVVEGSVPSEELRAAEEAGRVWIGEAASAALELMHSAAAASRRCLTQVRASVQASHSAMIDDAQRRLRAAEATRRRQEGERLVAAEELERHLGEAKGLAALAGCAERCAAGVAVLQAQIECRRAAAEAVRSAELTLKSEAALLSAESEHRRAAEAALEMETRAQQAREHPLPPLGAVEVEDAEAQCRDAITTTAAATAEVFAARWGASILAMAGVLVEGDRRFDLFPVRALRTPLRTASGGVVLPSPVSEKEKSATTHKVPDSEGRQDDAAAAAVGHTALVDAELQQQQQQQQQAQKQQKQQQQKQQSSTSPSSPAGTPSSSPSPSAGVSAKVSRRVGGSPALKTQIRRTQSAPQPVSPGKRVVEQRRRQSVRENRSATNGRLRGAAAIAARVSVAPGAAKSAKEAAAAAVAAAMRKEPSEPSERAGSGSPLPCAPPPHAPIPTVPCGQQQAPTAGDVDDGGCSVAPLETPSGGLDAAFSDRLSRAGFSATEQQRLRDLGVRAERQLRFVTHAELIDTLDSDYVERLLGEFNLAPGDDATRFLRML
eukprot:Hpha_TRINITY_DN15173_c2_g1::TRINITY_DN15173_c2_g1_i4::g.129158::m.129158